MKRIITLLVIVAVAQLLLIAASWQGSEQLQGQADTSTLLSFNKAEVDQIHIYGDDGEVVLEKKEGKWLTSPSFPANQDRVDTLLDKLAGLEYGLPVATSSSALTRFKVAADQFERLVRLQKGDQVIAELYLGAGAGARQSYGRSGDQQAVYPVAMGSYEAPCKVEDWQDRDILQLEKDSITAIELDGLTVTRNTEAQDDESRKWVVESGTDGKILDQHSVEESVKTVASLRFAQVLGRENKPEYGLDAPLLTFSLVYGDSRREYKLGIVQEADEYILKVSDRDEYFQLAGFAGKSVVEEINKEKWLQDESGKVGPEDEDG